MIHLEVSKTAVHFGFLAFFYFFIVVFCQSRPTTAYNVSR